MCGIAGFLGRLDGDAETADQVLANMGAALAHRGPDSAGQWFDPVRQIGLAHRRLAIIDLSAAGRQPMVSRSGRYVLTFNGEIYNHLKLRERLGGPWRGGSDTESLLAGFDAWGVQATVEAAVGMFAFAVWDRETRTLTLARDRLGEKPLYYGRQHGVFLFASELAALRAHPAFTGEIDRDAVRSFMRHGHVPGAMSIYRGLSKLSPGSLLSVSADGVETLTTYWSGAQTALASRDAPPMSEADAIEGLEALLSAAVGGQMMADVPLGVFLSGGIDSSTIAALAQARSGQPILTFSIGFRENAFNEAHHAARVAQHLGTRHIELYVTAQDALDVIPRLPTIYSEPFADPSQIPTFLLSKLAREHVTVALSGDGGDELFAGYRRHKFAGEVWPRLTGTPKPIRKALAAALMKLPSHWLDKVGAALGSTTRSIGQWTPTGERMHKAARLLAYDSLEDLYAGLVSHWTPVDNVVLGPIDAAPDQLAALGDLGNVAAMMGWDMLGYLPDDILTKVDRAAMAASLETRAPFLDHRVVEFAWRVPLSMKIRGSQAKWLLREVLHRYVPRGLVERPKAGFSIPLDEWLRGPLRDWSESLLSETSLERWGYLNPDPVRMAWAEHLTGARNNQQILWNALMLQAWLESGPASGQANAATIRSGSSESGIGVSRAGASLSIR